MRKLAWLLATVSILAIAACTTATQDYSICNDVNITNNDCPDVTANIVFEDDINGMNK